MPTPKPNQETRSQFIKRCIPEVIEDGTAKDSLQAAAICHTMWRDAVKDQKEGSG